MYYGNPAASDQQNAADVWANSYSAVWHLNQTTGTTFPDSTGSGNTGNVQGTPTLNGGGQIGPGVLLNANTEAAITSQPRPTFNDPQVVTVSVWFKTTSASGTKIDRP